MVNSIAFCYFLLVGALACPRPYSALQPHFMLAEWLRVFFKSQFLVGRFRVVCVWGCSYLMLNITAPSLCLYYNYHKYVARGNVHASNIFAYHLVHR